MEPTNLQEALHSLHNEHSDTHQALLTTSAGLVRVMTECVQSSGNLEGVMTSKEMQSMQEVHAVAMGFVPWFSSHDNLKALSLDIVTLLLVGSKA